MLYRDIIVAFSAIHTKHINASWAEHRISDCYSRWYVKEVLGFKMFNNITHGDNSTILDIVFGQRYIYTINGKLHIVLPLRHISCSKHIALPVT
jgi:hypothetical protein